ncbi:MAG: squalene--hopene cyclase [Thermoleophilia bacterium]|jgi:squalene-hopene/tetraprenyl-beta-curcumene cyclase|nr:squalene--hopene cyclase [Thermoleophilia bacterium]
MPPVQAPPDLVAAARRAAERGAEHLMGLQEPDGHWWGELESNATITAEHLFLLSALGIATDEDRRAVAAELLETQRPDGSWAVWFDGPPDLSTTLEAYYALRLAGVPADAAPMRRARDVVLALGGGNRVRFFTRLWLAVLGQYPWDALPTVPPEMVLLPPRAPFSIYRFACWARGTFVPLMVVLSRHPTYPQPVGIAELFPEPPGSLPGPPPRAPGWFTAFSERAMPALKAYNRRPVAGLRRLAERRIRDWIVARQEADGSWGGIQPPWVYSVIALHTLGLPLDHPVIRRALRGFDTFALRRGGRLRMQSCLSPVWDTALAGIGLVDGGVDPAHPAVQRARDWLIGREVSRRGDWWYVPRRGEAGGWSFEFANEWYPDVDDTAEVVLALLRAGCSPDHGAIRRAVRWMLAMQSTGGGWGAFDVDNDHRVMCQLPVCDFGEVIDPPTEDVTAHTLEALAACGLGPGHPAVRRGVAYLRRTQRPDGSWWGRWGVNHVYGTGAVIPALVACGEDPRAPYLRRAVDWLARHQNPDGGWGERVESYRDPAWVGRGPSTASQTAWALMGLLAAAPDHPAVAGGVEHLVRTQLPDGSWDEDAFTGTGFPGDFMIKYHYYRLYFPLTALGRYAA